MKARRDIAVRGFAVGKRNQWQDDRFGRGDTDGRVIALATIQ